MSKNIERRSPHLNLSKVQVQDCIDSLDTTSKVKDFVLASSGLANTNYIVTLESGVKAVLRIHTISENGLKEFKLFPKLTNISVVPRILYFQPAVQGGFSYSIVEFIDGTPLSESNANRKSLKAAYFELGVMLAQLKAIKFNSPGLLNENLDIVPIKTKITDYHPVTNFVLDCLENPNFINRVGTALKETTEKLVIEQNSLLFATDEGCHLVHGDFKIENIMVKSIDNEIHLSGVLDWEHARSDSSYGDIATLFRGDYDNNSSLKQAFSEGFKSKGAHLIQDWDKTSKLVDLVNICSFLCSDSNRPMLDTVMLKHLKNTILYFKQA